MPIHMYLPDDYLESQAKYPVLYMFDGHNLFFDEDATFGRSWRLPDHLGALAQPILIVGIECSHEGNERLSEYGPYDFYDPEFGGSFKGEGDKTMEFIVRTLKPYIDSHFPSRPNRASTWIGGSSCGGLMALYALCAYNKVFSRALCLSPYIAPSISPLLVLADTCTIRRPSRLYLSWGAREGWNGHEFVNETKNLTDLANLLMPKGVHIRFNVKPWGEHCEQAWEAEADEFLRYISS